MTSLPVRSAFIGPSPSICARENLGAADPRQAQQPQQPFLVEAFAFGGDLRLDHLAVVGQHEIAVAAGRAVLGIIEVEHRLCRRGCRSSPPRPCVRIGSLDQLPLAISLSTAMRSATQAPEMAAVRVPPSAWMTSQSSDDLALAELASRSTTARSERPISRWISCVRPDCLPLGRLAAAAGVGGARQHAIFGGDPALALAAQEGRHLVLDRGGARAPACRRS